MSNIKQVLAFTLISLCLLFSGCKKFGFGAKNSGSNVTNAASVCFQGLRQENIALVKKDDGTMVIKLKWEPVESDPNAKYEIYGDAKFTNLLGTTEQTEWEFNNPILAQTYVFSVRAVSAICTDTNSQYSLYETPLDRPAFKGVSKAVGTSNTKMWLEWEPYSDSKIKKYNVYFSKDLKNPIGNTLDTGFTVEALVKSSRYCFIVRVEDFWGTEDTNSVEKCAETITSDVPEFTGLKSVEQLSGRDGLTRLRLNWSEAAGLVTGYRVYMSKSPKSQDFEALPKSTMGAVTLDPNVGPYVDYNVLSPATSAIVDGLDPNTLYYFVVRAFYKSSANAVIKSELNLIEKSNKTLETIIPASPPVITKVNPSVGPFSGDNFIVISGANFHQSINVKIGLQVCKIPPVVSLDGKSLNCQVPKYEPALQTNLPVSITITNTDDEGTTTIDAAYTYSNTPGPRITSISPLAGALKGGTLITINGSNFVSGAKVFLDNECTEIQFLSPSQLSCKTVSHAAGIVSVKVVNPDSQFFTLSNAYTYRAPVVNKTATSLSGPVSGNTNYTIYGNHFLDTTVSVNGKPISCSLTTATSVVCELPPAVDQNSTSTVTVKIENRELESDTYQYTYLASPVITGTANLQSEYGPIKSPASGDFYGGTTIVVTGNNFSESTVIKIGQNPCISKTLIDANHINCVVPPEGANRAIPVLKVTPKPVIISASEGPFLDTKSNLFTYQMGPKIISVFPAFAQASSTSTQPIEVTVMGSGFYESKTILKMGIWQNEQLINVQNCNKVSVTVAGQTLTGDRAGNLFKCTILPRIAGTYDFVAVNDDGQTDRLPSAFSFIDNFTDFKNNNGWSLSGSTIVGDVGRYFSSAYDPTPTPAELASPYFFNFTSFPPVFPNPSLPLYRPDFEGSGALLTKSTHPLLSHAFLSTDGRNMYFADSSATVRKFSLDSNDGYIVTTFMGYPGTRRALPLIIDPANPLKNCIGNRNGQVVSDGRSVLVTTATDHYPIRANRVHLLSGAIANQQNFFADEITNSNITTTDGEYYYMGSTNFNWTTSNIGGGNSDRIIKKSIYSPNIYPIRDTTNNNVEIQIPNASTMMTTDGKNLYILAFPLTSTSTATIWKVDLLTGHPTSHPISRNAFYGYPWYGSSLSTDGVYLYWNTDIQSTTNPYYMIAISDLGTSGKDAIPLGLNTNGKKQSILFVGGGLYSVDDYTIKKFEHVQ